MHSYYEKCQYRQVDRNVIMLKAKIIDLRDVISPDSGVPQGGVLSPMLANVALNARTDGKRRGPENNE